MVAAKGDIRAIDETVALDGVVGGEIGQIAVVDGSLVRTQIEIVPQTEQVIWASSHFLPSPLLRYSIDR